MLNKIWLLFSGGIETIVLKADLLVIQVASSSNGLFALQSILDVQVKTKREASSWYPIFRAFPAFFSTVFSLTMSNGNFYNF